MEDALLGLQTPLRTLTQAVIVYARRIAFMVTFYLGAAAASVFSVGLSSSFSYWGPHVRQIFSGGKYSVVIQAHNNWALSSLPHT